MEPHFLYTYTREQAINDGVLVDVSTMAKEAGFKHPVAITSGVHEIIRAVSEEDSQDYKGRLWDLLSLFWHEARKTDDDTVYFSVYFIMMDSKLHEIKMWARCGPGDDDKPVITIMLIGED
ncbi:MAG: hypothetical protein NTU66_06040 [Elusimicrobia bacterium]|nr:hypothetical protein [Elusimicrobiota bacterium]